MRRWTLALCLFLTVSSIAAAETFTWAGGTSGWTESNMTFVLYKDQVAQSDPGITFTEDGSTGNYVVAGLTDTTGAEVYELLWSDPDGRLWRYAYPNRTATPQAVVWRFQYGIVAGTNVLSVGDTLPDLQVNVSGLSADPTGGSVTFTLWCDGTKVVDGKAGTISSVVDDGDTWSAVLGYDFVAADTATAGNCEGRFQLTTVGGEVMTLPPTRTVAVEIVP